MSCRSPNRFRPVFLLPIVLVAVVPAATAPAVQPAATARAGQPTPDATAIDRFVARQMAAQRIPGLALAITHRNQALYLKGYGTARAGSPVKPRTQFLVGSLSKSFTALAVMQLVESGRIDLDAPVRTYLPEFRLADPEAASRITIRQLLNQTGGLGDAGFPAMRLPQPATPAERVTSLRTARPIAPPGTVYNYHDVNYQVLARVVEVASGQAFSDYMQSHVFTPLHMVDTLSALTSDEARQGAGGLAQGHLQAFSVPIASQEESGYFAGSGGVVSTARDMANYLIMQANGGRFEGTALLSAEGVSLMHTPPPNVASDYAMGWVASTQNGVLVLQHDGILSTFYADMAVLPESGYAIALLYNVQSLAQASLGFPKIRAGLIDMLSGRQPRTGRLSVRTVEIVFAVVILASVGLAIRGLLRLPRWAERTRVAPLWRLVPGIVWAFVPGALVLTMPSIVLSTAGRAFGYVSLFRSMIEVMTWLGLAGLLGAVNGTARLAILARRLTSRRREPA